MLGISWTLHVNISKKRDYASLCHQNKAGTQVADEENTPQIHRI